MNINCWPMYCRL